jgi:hypothetical protein
VRKYRIASVAAVVVLGFAGAATASSAGAAADPDSAAPAVSSTYCGSNIWAVSITPAPGFDPLTANAAELDANGYPAEPSASDTAQYAQWQTYVTRHSAMNSSCASLQSTSTADIAPQGPSGTQPSTAAAANASIEYDNWAGYQVTDNPYQDAEADWTVPAVKSGNASNYYYSSSWVGLGQGKSNPEPLIQGGSETDYLGGLPSYFLWFEVWPEQPHQTKVDTNVSKDDSVGAHVHEANAPIGGCTAPACGFIHLWDTTAHRGFNAEYVVGGDWVNEGTAEWIYERPCEYYGGSTCTLPYLTDAPPLFTGAQAAYPSAGWQSISSLPTTYISMWNCAFTTQLAHPNAIGGESFGFRYDNPGDSGVCGL